GFDLFHKMTTISTYQPYNSRTTGGAVRLGFPIAENLWLTNSYSLSNNAITDVQSNASLAIKQAAGEYWTSSLGASLSYDARNHPKSPTSGYYLQLGGEFAGLGGDVQYIRTSAEGRAYYPVTEKITLVGRVIGGHIEGWGGQDVRLLDLFYKGGETIRGFNRSGIGPRDLNTSDALGGDTFWAATAEIRFPLPLVPEDMGLKGAVFYDAGSLFGAGAGAKKDPGCAPFDTTHVCLVDSDAVRTSAGASLIWDSPLGPLRLDIAEPITKKF